MKIFLIILIIFFINFVLLCNSEEYIYDYLFSNIEHRNDIIKLCDKLNLKTGIELGVQRAEFSKNNLANWKSCTSYSLVDIWANQINYVDSANVDNSEQELILKEAQNNVFPWKDKVKFYRNSTLQAATLVPDDSLDFIYVDARHDYCGVSDDINAWYAKLKVGGIMAGHDYLSQDDLLAIDRKTDQDWSICQNGTINRAAVKGAVNDFASKNNIKIYTTLLKNHDGPYTSWIYQPKTKSASIEITTPPTSFSPTPPPSSSPTPTPKYYGYVLEGQNNTFERPLVSTYTPVIKPITYKVKSTSSYFFFGSKSETKTKIKTIKCNGNLDCKNKVFDNQVKNYTSFSTGIDTKINYKNQKKKDNSRINILVFSVWVGSDVSLDASRLNHRQFCENNGYEYKHFFYNISEIIFPSNRNNKAITAWGSLMAISELFLISNADYFFKVDIDNHFTKPLFRLENFIDPLERYSMYYLAPSISHFRFKSTHSWIAKNNNYSREFIYDWWSYHKKGSCDDMAMEQGASLLNLGEKISLAFGSNFSEYDCHTKCYTRRNSYRHYMCVESWFNENYGENNYIYHPDIFIFYAKKILKSPIGGFSLEVPHKEYNVSTLHSYYKDSFSIHPCKSNPYSSPSNALNDCIYVTQK
jgi:hypothetical protein